MHGAYLILVSSGAKSQKHIISLFISGNIIWLKLPEIVILFYFILFHSLSLKLFLFFYLHICCGCFDVQISCTLRSLWASYIIYSMPTGSFCLRLAFTVKWTAASTQKKKGSELSHSTSYASDLISFSNRGLCTSQLSVCSWRPCVPCVCCAAIRNQQGGRVKCVSKGHGLILV